MRFYFLNNAEPKIYQALLNKTNFELIFDKEKVSYECGGSIVPIDNTLHQAPDSRMLECKFSPQFAGIIIYLNDLFGFKSDQISFQKLDQKPSPNRLPAPSGPLQKNPPSPDNEDEKIRQLETRIRELEEKLRSQPNSPTHQNDQNELNRLKNELNRLKGTDNSQSNKAKFPYGLVIGGGIVFVILLLLEMFLVIKKKKR
ncbi:MAG: hypothetical protein MRERC_12c018 [Mycoplasmataceae bacterium RC_NB112A]|nr:MAG: hypothetical protein MRERC_12c018 [Mycoplasmataceae bacterium RC_NB112A]